ncbi:alpha/beta hydrolase [Roseibium sp.]|uniref:alpha/beta hydrolase n=1 Tax=Roseibium sp. TaxID=1936156 RepID=UPI003A978706
MSPIPSQIDAVLEIEYDNRGRVPEHPALIAGWQADAARYRTERPEAECDIIYGSASRQVFDLFPALPGTPERQRSVLFIHGGYWQALSKDFFSHMARGLNARGFDVVIANYSLCPEVTVREIEEELRVLASVLHQRFGRKLIVTGHSAGGHLTASLMATDWGDRNLPADLCDRGLPISGLFDLVPLVSTSVNTALQMTEATARAASPMKLSPAPGSRFIAVVGGAESSEYLRQSRQLVEKWSADGASAELDIVPDANHFTVIAPLADPNSDLVDHLVALGNES